MEVGVEVHERFLPGVGRKYSILPEAGGELVVVIHHSGRRELLYFGAEESEPDLAIQLSDAEAKELGAILSGFLFQPELGGKAATELVGQSIEWHQLPVSSNWVDQTVADLQIQGVYILAVLRQGDILIPNPAKDVRLEASDTIIVAGERELIDRFRSHYEAGL